VSLVSPWPSRSAAKQIEPSSEAGDTLKITCNFLYCNHQVHRDFDHPVLYYTEIVGWGKRMCNLE
jgi:hypothetical protein